jgi:hypothetical protein
MPLVLRKIRKARWYKKDVVSWLKEGELQADVFVDLKTDANKLSLWLVEDNKSNLDRIIAAVASTSDDPSNIDFALFHRSLIDSLKINSEKTSGESHDQEANQLWHLNLIELSADKLFQLAQEIQKHGEKDRFYEKQVINLLIESIKAGKIPKNNLKEKLQRGIDKIASRVT